MAIRKRIRKVARVGIRIAKYAQKEMDKELRGMIKEGIISSAKGIKLARNIARRTLTEARKIDALIRKELKEKPKAKAKKKRKKKR